MIGSEKEKIIKSQFQEDTLFSTGSKICKEYVIAEEYSKSWNKNMPAKLVIYWDRDTDLLIQTGDHFEELLKKSIEVLKDLGLVVNTSGDTTLGICGVYMEVTEC